MLVCKFGGSVLGGASGFAQAQSIVRQNPDRRWIVPSAPGKRDARDEKMTDLLYACQSAAAGGSAFTHIFDRVAQRIRELARSLSLPAPDAELRKVFLSLRAGQSPAYAASRGEYFSARLLSQALELPFVDAAEVICFDASGVCDQPQTLSRLRQRLLPLKGAVIPGFYGADAQGRIHTFPRGGSDVTASLVAAALNADACENWKDVRGVYAADPRIVPQARCIAQMTYAQLRAYSRLGAQVLCDAAVAPVRAAGIPLRIRSAAEVSHPGTLIHTLGEGRPGVIGVTGLTGLRLQASQAQNFVALLCDADESCCLLRDPEGSKALCAVVGSDLARLDALGRMGEALCAAGVESEGAWLLPEGQYAAAIIAAADFPRAVRALYEAFIAI